MTGPELKTIRERMGLTQQAFAEKLGFKSWNTVSKWERGKLAVPQVVIKLIDSKINP